MRYETCCEDLAQSFPELADALQRLQDDGELGAYIYFESVLRVFVEEVLASPSSQARDALLKRVFGFVESMLESGGEVENLAYISILEGQSGAWLREAKPFLGTRAVEALDQYASEWRDRYRSDNSQLDTSDAIDLYGAKAIARSKLASG